MNTQTQTKTITTTNVTTSTVEPFPYYFNTLEEYKNLLTSTDVHQRYITASKAKTQAVRWALRVKKQHGLNTVREILESEMQKLSLDLDYIEHAYMIEFETRVLGSVSQYFSIDFFYHTP